MAERATSVAKVRMPCILATSEPASEVADALDARLIKPKLKCGRGGMADALDLGSSVLDVQVQVLLPAPNRRNPNPKPVGEGFGFLFVFGDM